MSSGVTGKTPQYGFNLINFDFPRWGSLDQENWRLLDSILQSAGLATQGIWRNSTDYAAGTRAVDNESFKVYVANVTHTSAATGLFSADRAANPTFWTEALSAPIYRGVWATFTFYNFLDIVSFADGSMFICITAHTSGGAFDASKWTQTGAAFPTTFAYASITGKPTDFQADFNATVTNPPPLAQCQLSLSGGNLILSRKDGKYLWIDGANRLIPTTPPSLAPSGLLTPQSTTNRQITASVVTLTFASNSFPVGAFVGVKGVRNGTNYKGYAGPAVVSAQSGTTISYPSKNGVVTDASAADTTGTVVAVYYIYAFLSAGAMTLEASFTGYTIDTATGMPLKTGDTTRTLVGMAAIDTGPAWIDTSIKRYVRSYFNRRQKMCHRELSSNDVAALTTAGTNPAEMSVSYRSEWLMWSDESAEVTIQGACSVSVAGQAYSHCVIDNVLTAGNGPIYSPAGGNVGTYLTRGRILENNEGYHYSALWGQVSTGTGTWSGGDPAAGGNCGSHDVRIG